MSWENEINLSDVSSAGLVVSDRIGRDVASHLDLEEALEASRYSSHPYSTHPREVHIILFVYIYILLSTKLHVSVYFVLFTYW